MAASLLPVAVDAMGGDRAPGDILAGAHAAAACVRLEPDGDNAVNPIIKWICQLLRPASNVPIQAHLALSQFGPTVSAL